MSDRPSARAMAELWQRGSHPDIMVVPAAFARLVERVSRGHSGWHRMLEDVRAAIEAPGFVYADADVLRIVRD